VVRQPSRPHNVPNQGQVSERAQRHLGRSTCLLGSCRSSRKVVHDRAIPSGIVDRATCSDCTSDASGEVGGPFDDGPRQDGSSASVGIRLTARTGPSSDLLIAVVTGGDAGSPQSGAVYLAGISLPSGADDPTAQVRRNSAETRPSASWAVIDTHYLSWSDEVTLGVGVSVAAGSSWGEGGGNA
jgi:hypothetical protein